MSECGKFIVTAERDEKIRVTCYPDTYNIHTFCFGHTEYALLLLLEGELTGRLVSSLVVDGDRLFSGAADSLVIQWAYKEGKETGRFDVRECIPDHLKSERLPVISRLRLFGGLLFAVVEEYASPILNGGRFIV